MVRISLSASPEADRALLRLILLAFAACALTALSGLAAVHYYTPHYPLLQRLGLSFQSLRPIHTAFASAWMFLGGITAVYFYMFTERGKPDRRVVGRLNIQTAVWAASGAGVLVTLLLGIFSGREYIGFHPALSLPIFAGWLIFLWNFRSAVGLTLRGRPVYVYMWITSLFLFIYTFLEGHLYLLDAVGLHLQRDIAIQWKSYGALVGSFNLLVYGSLIFLSEKISGDTRYARSNMGFALLFLGLLNSFTNFAHHTYHLPQSHVIKYISYSVSMLEIIVLFKVLLDISGLMRWWASGTGYIAARALVVCSTFWTLLQLTLAILLSIPPVNTLLHGTHAVMAHAMGSMIGIDSMILWAFFAYCLQRMLPAGHRVHRSRAVLASIALINVALFINWSSLLLEGAAKGWESYTGTSGPTLVDLMVNFPAVFAFSGAAMAFGILALLWIWTRALLGPEKTRSLMGELPEEPDAPQMTMPV